MGHVFEQASKGENALKVRGPWVCYEYTEQSIVPLRQQLRDKWTRYPHTTPAMLFSHASQLSWTPSQWQVNTAAVAAKALARAVVAKGT